MSQNSRTLRNQGSAVPVVNTASEVIFYFNKKEKVLLHTKVPLNGELIPHSVGLIPIYDDGNILTHIMISDYNAKKVYQDPELNVYFRPLIDYIQSVYNFPTLQWTSRYTRLHRDAKKYADGFGKPGAGCGEYCLYIWRNL